MRSKIMKLFFSLRIAIRQPSLVRKFFREIWENGFNSALLKIKRKLGVPGRVAQKINLMPLSKLRKMPLHFPQTEMPRVSIIISFYVNSDILERCLWSILSEPPSCTFEVVILNFNSENNSNFLQEKVKNVLVLSNESKLKFSEFQNGAIASARGDLILLLDAWTQVSPGWLDTVVEQMDLDPLTGVIGPKLIFADGKLMEAGRIVWKDGSLSHYGKFDDPEKPEFNYLKEVDSLSERCLIFRKSLWKVIGGLNNSYSFPSGGYREADLAFSARSLGLKVVYNPKILVICFEFQENSSGDLLSLMDDRERFRSKWKGDLARGLRSAGEDFFLARDRSWQRKHILVVDHYVPTFDQDAGSRTMWQYLHLMNDLGYHITFIPDNFYASEPYTSELEKKGIHVRYGREAMDSLFDWLVENGRYFDIAFLSRPDVASKYITILREVSGAKIVYFGHDLHYVRLEKEFAVIGHSSTLSEIEKFKKLELNLFSVSDLVLMFNQNEVEFINQYTNSSKAKKVELFFYPQIPLIEPKGFLNQPTALFVGGFHHPPNVDGIHWFVSNVVPIVRKNLENFNLVVAGSNPPPSVVNLSKVPGVEIRGYVDDATLKSLYRESMLVVVPLRYGAGVKGKTVEAMSHGLPVVSTSTGAEGLEEVEDYIVIADNADTMAESIIVILGCREIWERRAKLSTEYALLNFSYSAVRKKFSDILSDTLCV